ncbi:MAG: hypothetical protein GY749_06465 [Desulfobacteraceae bacterium]|nr:hypothetical protein [Desulfobacteraceae bacterium]
MAGEAAKYKVLAVTSYHPEFLWQAGIITGITATLAETSEIKYIHLDTKRNFKGGPDKAKDAYALYQKWQPDGVIVSDDNAQTMFVIPYLREKVNTPVMFCGISAEPEEYGYPASNVSGILERLHYKESIAFLQQLVPSVKTVGGLMLDNVTGKKCLKQWERESATFPAKAVAFKLVKKTLADVIAATEELRPQCDALFIANLEAILDANGTPMKAKDVGQKIGEVFGKPMLLT